MIERQERANQAAHERFDAAQERFEEENERLLTAQIPMNDSLQRLLDVVAKNEAKADTFDERMIVLESKMEEATDKLNAQISTADGLIRKTN